MNQNIGHALCSCGHVRGTHCAGKGLCQLKGCGCHAFFLDGYIEAITPASRGEQVTKPINVAGDWI